MDKKEYMEFRINLRKKDIEDRYFLIEHEAKKLLKEIEELKSNPEARDISILVSNYTNLFTQSALVIDVANTEIDSIREFLD